MSSRRFRASVRGGVAAALVVSMVMVGAVALPQQAAQADTAPDPSVPQTVSADALPTWQINGVIWSQVTVGNTVYATGSFTRARPPGVAAGGVGEIVANNIFAFDIRTGNRVATFDHSLNAQGRAITATPDGSRIFVGGDFTTVDGAARGHIAAFDTATGALVSNFTPNIGGTVRALTANNTRVYAGGAFTVVSGQSRLRLASFATSNGAIQPWNPSADDNTVWAMVLSPDNSRVIAGGAFTTINGAAAYGMGAVDSITGASLPWAATQKIRDATNSGAITSLRADDEQVYGSGYAYGGPTNFEGEFAADPTTGEVNWLNDCHGDTYDVLPIGDVLYSVSHKHDCSWIGQFPEVSPRRWKWATASTTYPTGVNVGPDNYGWNHNGTPAAHLLHWYPSLSIGTASGQNQAGWSLTGNADYISLGGEFPRVNNVNQQGLVRFARPGLATNKRGMENANLAPVANSVSADSARVTWTAQWDMDNEKLRYDVFRDGGTTPIGSVTGKSDFTNRPTMVYVDHGVAAGSSHTYRVKVVDPFNNSWTSPASAPVTISGTPRSDYANLILDHGARNFWRLGETSGLTMADLTGARHATAQSGVTRNIAGAITGDTDRATTFTGASNGYASTDSSAAAPTTFTAEAWFKTSTNRGGKIIGYGSARTGESSSYDRHVYMDNNGRILFGTHAGAARTIMSPATYNNNQWHHVVASLGGDGGQRLFIDGQLVAQNTNVISGEYYNGYWRIGGDRLSGWTNRPTSYWFAGTIDEVAVYEKELTLAQVQSHYEAGGGSVPNISPVAEFSSSTDDLVASFDGTASSDPDGTIVSYTWDFGDGNNGTGVTPSHTYALGGTYNAQLTVTDNDGATNSVTHPVTVTPNQAPNADFTWSANNLVASFDGTTSSDPDGTIASYAWDFGDGDSGTGPSPLHPYVDPGTYDVILTVTDNDGATDSVTHSVTVSGEPTPFLIASDDFARSLATGWGTADLGGAWTTTGAASASGVDSGSGRLTMATATSGPQAYLGTLQSDDTDLVMEVSVDKVPVGGTAGVDQAFLVRRVANEGDYRAKVRILPGGAVRIGISRTSSTGAQTVIVAETVVSGLTYAAGDQLTIRAQATGTTPTTVRAKVWRVGDTEPATWQVTGSDSTVGLQTTGGVGVQSYLGASVTNTPIVARFDNLRVHKASTLP
jgi:PKD repeat protein